MDYAPNLNSLTDLSATQKAATGGQISSLQNQTNDFLKRYSGAVGGQESMTNMASRLGGQLNLPTLQKNAQSAQQSVYDIPSVYSAATRGFDVNSNQLSRIQDAQTAKLAPIAQRAQDQANTAQGNLNTLLGYGQTDQSKQLLPYQAEQSLLPGLQSTTSNLFSQQQGNELQALVSKINSGVALTQTEMNNANQLALAKQNFENTQALNQQQADLSATKNRYISLSYGGDLYDTLTGQVVTKNARNVAGSGYAPSPSVGGGFNFGNYTSG